MRIKERIFFYLQTMIIKTIEQKKLLTSELRIKKFKSINRFFFSINIIPVANRMQ